MPVEAVEVGAASGQNPNRMASLALAVERENQSLRGKLDQQTQEIERLKTDRDTARRYASSLETGRLALLEKEKEVARYADMVHMRAEELSDLRWRLGSALLALEERARLGASNQEREDAVQKRQAAAGPRDHTLLTCQSIDALLGEIEALNLHVANLEQQRALFLASSSWKLTKPWRAIGRLLQNRS